MFGVSNMFERYMDRVAKKKLILNELTEILHTTDISFDELISKGKELCEANEVYEVDRASIMDICAVSYNDKIRSNKWKI